MLRGQYYCGDVSSKWVDLAYDNGNLLMAITNLLGLESSFVFLTLDSITLSQRWIESKREKALSLAVSRNRYWVLILQTQNLRMD